jgi:hypothetical protein
MRLTCIKDPRGCGATIFFSRWDFAMHNVISARPKIALIADLLPTQITVGMREVAFKRNRWRNRDREAAERFLNAHAIPVVVGPGARHFITDHHHLARALHDEGVIEAPVSVVGDLGTLSRDEFWSALEGRNWSHPFDDTGERRDYTDVPKSLDDLIDDPFRSLAGALKRAGGYTKDKAPFSEFCWADFLRDRIGRQTIECDFDFALALAVRLARSHEARALPGWLGPSSSTEGADQFIDDVHPVADVEFRHENRK